MTARGAFQLLTLPALTADQVAHNPGLAAVDPRPEKCARWPQQRFNICEWAWLVVRDRDYNLLVQFIASLAFSLRTSAKSTELERRPQPEQIENTRGSTP